MIVLRKKRLILTAYLILTCVFVAIYTVSSKQKSTDAVLVSALPVSDKVIVLDARTWKARRTEQIELKREI